MIHIYIYIYVYKYLIIKLAISVQPLIIQLTLPYLCYICSFYHLCGYFSLLMPYALLAVVYVSHVEERSFEHPSFVICFSKHHQHHHHHASSGHATPSVATQMATDRKY
jgi:hypothetical protein